MTAVDWLLLGERACTWAGMAGFACIGVLVLILAADSLRAWLRDRAWPRTPIEHSDSNVIRLVPRDRPYDWSADERGLA